MKDYMIYYKQFMGYGLGPGVYQSAYRDQPINRRYYYPQIVTEIDKYLIVSTSEALYEESRVLFDLDRTVIERRIDDRICRPYVTKTMYRMTAWDYGFQDSDAKEVNEVLLHSIHMREGFTPSGYIKNNHERIQDKRDFFAIKDGHMIGRGFISDIYCGGANIVLYVFPEYRGRGYGKDLLKQCMNWCLTHKLMPIYYVEAHNHQSRSLARSLGFKDMHREFVVQKL